MSGNFHHSYPVSKCLSFLIPAGLSSMHNNHSSKPHISFFLCWNIFRPLSNLASLHVASHALELITLQTATPWIGSNLVIGHFLHQQTSYAFYPAFEFPLRPSPLKSLIFFFVGTASRCATPRILFLVIRTNRFRSRITIL